MLRILFKTAVFDYDGVIADGSSWAAFNQVIKKKNITLYRKIAKINKGYTKRFCELSASEYFQWFDTVINLYKSIGDLDDVIDRAAYSLKPIPGAIDFMNNFCDKNICIISCGIGEVIQKFLKNHGFSKEIKVYANYITQDYDENNLVYGSNKDVFLNDFVKNNKINLKKTIIFGDTCMDTSMFHEYATGCMCTPKRIIPPDLDHTKVDLFIESFDDLINMYQ